MGCTALRKTVVVIGNCVGVGLGVEVSNGWLLNVASIAREIGL